MRALVINAIGAGMTAVVLIVVTVTKFTHGAWIVFVMMPILFFLMMGVNRYYRDVEKEIEVDPTTTFGATGDHAIVLVGRMQKPTLKALDYAIAARHDSLEAVHVSIDDESTKQLKKDWVKQNIHVKLRILSSPYRDLSHPLIQYIKSRREEHGSEVITVYMPQYIVGHWWENILHNHKARRIRQKLMLVHGVTVALVPWLLDSSDLIYGRRSRPLPGQDRRGEPVRPVPRRPIAESPPHRCRARRSAAARLPRMAVDADVRAFIDSGRAPRAPTRRRDAARADGPGHRPARTHVGYPRSWASAAYHYRYESGREGDAPAAGFAPRKAADDDLPRRRHRRASRPARAHRPAHHGRRMPLPEGPRAGRRRRARGARAHVVRDGERRHVRPAGPRGRGGRRLTGGRRMPRHPLARASP